MQVLVQKHYMKVDLNSIFQNLKARDLKCGTYLEEI